VSGTKSSTFFWSDWMSEPGLRRSSYAARGLWMDMLCLAAMADRVGYLEYTIPDLAKMTGGTEPMVEALIAELEMHRVFSRTRRGVIYSRRMANAEKMRAVAVKNGKKGGNPNLRKTKENQKPDNLNANPRDPEGVGPIGARPALLPSQAPSPIPIPSIAKPSLDLEAALRQAAGWEREPHPGLCVTGPIEQLIANGSDLERDVMPVVKALAPKARSRSNWKFFVDAIADATKTRIAAGGKLGNGKGTALDWRTFDHAEYARMVAYAKRQGRWFESLGPVDKIPADLVDDELRRICELQGANH
jgi:hypothetical protein